MGASELFLARAFEGETNQWLLAQVAFKVFPRCMFFYFSAHLVTEHASPSRASNSVQFGSIRSGILVYTVQQSELIKVALNIME